MGHKFQKEQGRVYGNIWREKWEGENDVIILYYKDKRFKNVW